MKIEFDEETKKKMMEIQCDKTLHYFKQGINKKTNRYYFVWINDEGRHEYGDVEND